MKNVLIILLISNIFIYSCKNYTVKNEKLNSINENSTFFTLNFTKITEITKNINDVDWNSFEEIPNNYIINLNLSNGSKYKIAIPLVARNIPFHFQVNKLNDSVINFNATQLFNTIWTDSIIISNNTIERAYRVNYKPTRTFIPLKIETVNSSISLKENDF